LIYAFDKKNAYVQTPFFSSINCNQCQHIITKFDSEIQKLKNVRVHLISLAPRDALNCYLQLYDNHLPEEKNIMLLRGFNNGFIQKANNLESLNRRS